MCTDRQIDFIIDPERLQFIFVSRARRKRPLPNLLRHLKGSELNPDSFLHFCLKLPGKREGERALFVAHANFSWCEAKIEGRRLTSGAHPESPSDTRSFVAQPPFQMRESECEASNSSQASQAHSSRVIAMQRKLHRMPRVSLASSDNGPADLPARWGSRCLQCHFRFRSAPKDEIAQHIFISLIATNIAIKNPQRPTSLCDP